MPYMVKDLSTDGSDRGGKIIRVYSKDETDTAIDSGGGGGGSVPDPTSSGDILYSEDGSSWIRLGVGDADQVLTVSGGVPSWEDSGGGDGGFPENLQFWDDFASSPKESHMETGEVATHQGTYWTWNKDGFWASDISGVDNGSWIALNGKGGEGEDGWTEMYFVAENNGNGWQIDQNFYMDIRISLTDATQEFFCGFVKDGDDWDGLGSLPTNLLGLSFESGDSFLNIEEGDGTRQQTSTANSATTYVFRIYVQINSAPETPSVTIYRGTSESNLTEIGNAEYLGNSTDLWYPYFVTWSDSDDWWLYIDYVKVYADRGDPGSPHGGG